MIKKRGRTRLPESGTLIAPSSTLLDNHFEELLEAVGEIRGLTILVKPIPSIAD